VFVVDDDDSLLEAVAEVLEDDGYAVIVAFSGEQAWTMLQTHAPKPDVLLLDLLMPHGNGWSLMKRIRQEPKLLDIPVVTMSGLDASLAETVPGAAAHIAKPLEMHVLLDAMRLALSERGRAAPAPRARLW